jgi:hypothetical protein
MYIHGSFPIKATIIALAGCAIPLHAANLIYFEETGSASTPRGLYNFDTSTGLSTLRTAVGGTERFFSMAVRPSDNQAFALSFGTTSSLYKINLNTGAFSLVGSTQTGDMLGLAVNPFTGQLYGLKNQTGLYSINSTTGQATLIGSAGDVNRGLDFSPSGNLFGFSNGGALYRVNPATGAATPVGGTGAPMPMPPPAGIMEDAAFTAAGELYTGDFSGNIYRMDPTTGNGVLVGTTGMGTGLLGMVADPLEVPEPTTGGLLFCAIAGLPLLRRKNRQSEFSTPQS